MTVDWRTEARRYAAPVPLLVVATVAALLVRSSLRDAPGTAAEPARSAPRVETTAAAAGVYVIGPGDTLAIVAGRHGTTVDRLLALNPRVEPTTLRVGQRIRVPPPRR